MDEQLVKREFIRETIEKDIRDIFQAQFLIASQRIYSRGRSRTQRPYLGSIVQGRSGALMEALQNPRYNIINSGDGVIATSNIPMYIRFLDMKKYGNYQIYNRQVWGVLYNNTIQTLRWGYSNAIRERITIQLKEALS